MITKEWLAQYKLRREYFKANAPKNYKSFIMKKAWELYRETLKKESYFKPTFKSALQKSWKQFKDELYPQELKKSIPVFFSYDARRAI